MDLTSLNAPALLAKILGLPLVTDELPGMTQEVLGDPNQILASDVGDVSLSDVEAHWGSALQVRPVMALIGSSDAFCDAPVHFQGNAYSVALELRLFLPKTNGGTLTLSETNGGTLTLSETNGGPLTLSVIIDSSNVACLASVLSHTVVKIDAAERQLEHMLADTKEANRV